MKALLCLFALGAASCSPTILVIDEAGRPIEDARVTPMSRSFSWPHKMTDKKGGAFVHQDVPTINYVRVSKMGYHPHPPVNFDLPKPITVILAR